MNDMTERTLAVIQRLFPQTSQDVANLLSTECGNNLPLAGTGTEEGHERIQLAILKLSDGDAEKLMEAVRLAKMDWRDVLVAADFGNSLKAHKEWADRLM